MNPVDHACQRYGHGKTDQLAALEVFLQTRIKVVINAVVDCKRFSKFKDQPVSLVETLAVAPIGQRTHGVPIQPDTPTERRMGGDSVVAVVELGGVQPSQLAVARGDYRVAVEGLDHRREAFQEGRVVSEDLHDVEDVTPPRSFLASAELPVNLLDGAGCLLRFDQGNSGHGAFPWLMVELTTMVSDPGRFCSPKDGVGLGPAGHLFEVVSAVARSESLDVDNNFQADR